MKNDPLREVGLRVPVLLVFFVRSETFEHVFEAVRKAQPPVLLLWQDGPRKDRPDDLEGIAACREIAERVDWECTVYRKYNDTNLGCDPSTFYAFKWAFSLVDQCIVLEDDQVPSQSFFRYCGELLDRYKDDTRINHICGYNPYGEATWCPNDYLFAYFGTGAWASWKRVACEWDETYSFLHDTYAVGNLREKFGPESDLVLRNARRHEATGKAYWETIIGMNCMLNSRFAIVPKRNLVRNIGFVGVNATHSSIDDQRLLPDEAKELSIAHELDFPIRHPRFVQADEQYARRVYQKTKSTPTRILVKNVAMAAKAIRYGRSDIVTAAVMRRLKRLLGAHR